MTPEHFHPRVEFVFRCGNTNSRCSMYNNNADAGGRGTCAHPERKGLTNIVGVSNATPVWCPLRVEAVEAKLVLLRIARGSGDAT